MLQKEGHYSKTLKIVIHNLWRYKYTVLWQYMTLGNSLAKNKSPYSLKVHLLFLNFMYSYCFWQKHLRQNSEGYKTWKYIVLCVYSDLYTLFFKTVNNVYSDSKFKSSKLMLHHTTGFQ